MHTDPHAAMRGLMDKSLAGAASASEEQSVREHLLTCPDCAAYVEAGNRAIAALHGFSFHVEPDLEAKVLAAVALRAQELETKHARRRRMEWGGLLALLLTAAGSVAALRVGGLAAPVLDLNAAQVRLGLTALWITPSLLFCVLMLLLPAFHAGSGSRKGVSL